MSVMTPRSCPNQQQGRDKDEGTQVAEDAGPVPQPLGPNTGQLDQPWELQRLEGHQENPRFSVRQDSLPFRTAQQQGRVLGKASLGGRVPVPRARGTAHDAPGLYGTALLLGCRPVQLGTA